MLLTLLAKRSPVKNMNGSNALNIMSLAADLMKEHTLTGWLHRSKNRLHGN